MKKHAIVNGKIGYAFLLENLPSIGENDCTFNSVVWRFKETGERAVLCIVLSGFYLQGKDGQTGIVIYKKIYFAFFLIVIIM